MLAVPDHRAGVPDLSLDKTGGTNIITNVNARLITILRHRRTAILLCLPNNRGAKEYTGNRTEVAAFNDFFSAFPDLKTIVSTRHRDCSFRLYSSGVYPEILLKVRVNVVAS